VSAGASRPVLLVHGIWDTGSELAALRREIERRGRLVEALRRESGHGRIDLVGFSMGALVSRTYIQREGGRETVRRFVSISGPHAGTLGAQVLPLEGVRDMRPGSALLRDLASDAEPWGDVEVHVLYTPFDLMILPPRSSELRGARTTTRIPVLLHRLMIVSPRATGAVADRLGEAG
jgi:triacylglycerol lipase